MSKAYNIATNLAAYQNTFDNPNVLNMNTVNVTDINSSNNATLKNLKMSSTSHEWTIKGIDSAIGDTQAGVSPDTTDADSGQLAIYNGATRLWGINESGWIQQPNIPAFFAKRTDITAFSSGIFVFNLVEYDNTNSYSGTTGLFTAPISGFYHFTTTLVGASGGDRTLIQFRVNGSIVGYLQHLQSVYSNQEPANTTSITYYLSSGDTMEIYVSNSVRTNISNVNHFSGHFVG